LKKPTSRRKTLPAAIAAAAALAVLFLALSLALPTLLSSNYYQKSLNLLRAQAESIKKEFAGLLRDQREKQQRLAQSPFPEKSELWFEKFRRLNLTPEVEGVAAYTSQGKLTIWLGNALNLEDVFQDWESVPLFQGAAGSFLIKDKASSYLVSVQKVRRTEYIALYRLLAFSPQFKSPYLSEYYFLKSHLRKNCVIEYWDFRDDISGTENFFSRHQDEYIGSRELQREIQTLFFPLRNEQQKIIATVTLRSPSLATFRLAMKETFLLVFYLLIVALFVLLLVHIARLPAFYQARKIGPGLLLVLALAGLRFVFFPLSRLASVQSLPIFSPTLSGFLSVGDFTKSPADIFLTSLCLCLLLAVIAFTMQALFERLKKKSASPLSVIANVLAITASIAVLTGFQILAGRLVFNSSINLLRFSLTWSFVLLHWGLVFVFAGAAFLLFTGLRIAGRLTSRPDVSIILLLAVEVLVYLRYGRSAPLLFVMQVIATIALFGLALWPKIAGRREAVFAGLLLMAVFIYGTLHQNTAEKARRLTQNFLKDTVVAQDVWADFLMREAFSEIDKQKKTVLAFLKAPTPAPPFSSASAPPDIARSLWTKTPLYKFNWYSSLEILDPEDNILSRFSLNIPKIFRAAESPAERRDWEMARLTIPFMGKGRDFLIGYRDWFEDEKRLGKTVFYMSLDYDMLPFLYSANPYFELLRVNSLPSLNQFDFRFAVFDLDGKILFNPHKISAGLPSDLLLPDALGAKGRWTAFIDREKKCDLFYFRSANRIYGLFMPQKSVVNFTIEFFRLFFFYLLIFILPLLAASVLWSGKKLRHPLWSFSNRVYLSFIAVALIPLVLFTFFSRNFFNRILSQQFIEKAEIQANTARSVMDDFFYFQQLERAQTPTLPEDLVLGLSTAIDNDVNLYEDGRLVFSSRREFFDSGLFPELLDGEIYYKIQFENNPFYAKKRSLGSFSFRTLTIPYTFIGPLLLISLPFPFEQQEIAEATRELLEFLLFISVFFIATVLVLARGIGAMIVTPIERLLAGTKEASLGNLEIEIDYKTQDEMRTLVDGFNAMIKNLKSREQELAEMSKKVAWAEVARKVAHEVKNPLTPIQLSAEHLLKVYEDKKGNFDQVLKESISYIISEVDNLRKIAQDFLEVSKETVLHKEDFRFDELVRQTVEPYKNLLAERILFRESYEGTDFRFAGDPAKLKVALRNLLTNAIESIQGKGEIRVRVARRPERLVVEVEDSGSGIDKEILDRIFEPYFSTKDVGTGLGLPIAKKIVEDHQGTLHIRSEPRKGTKITIDFPLQKN
jgi:signal transduction histidine kinase